MDPKQLKEKYKKQVLDKLDEIKKLIETEEFDGDDGFNASTLAAIDDSLEEILGCWYY